MSLLSNIKKLCSENKTTIPALQKELGFGTGTIYKWDKNQPTLDKIKKVAERFNVTLDELTGFEKREGPAA